jgi:hypothetical protein
MGGVLVFAGERVHTGESFHRERDRPGITDLTPEGNAVELAVWLRPGRHAARR